MNARVVRQFGMERCRHHIALPHQDRIAAARGKNLDASADVLDARRADEDHLQWLGAERARRLDDGGIDLPAVGVAANGDVERIQAELMQGSPLRCASMIAPAQVPKVGLRVDELVQLVEGTARRAA